jgi:hypothetical protein
VIEQNKAGMEWLMSGNGVEVTFLCGWSGDALFFWKLAWV